MDNRLQVTVSDGKLHLIRYGIVLTPDEARQLMEELAKGLAALVAPVAEKTAGHIPTGSGF